MSRKRLGHSPLDAQQAELAKREAELRRQMDDLQKLIQDAPKKAEEEQERLRQDRLYRASFRRSPMDSPDILTDIRHEDLFDQRPRRPRRAQRRAARTRLLVMVLGVLVLVGVVIFLAIQMFNKL